MACPTCSVAVSGASAAGSTVMEKNLDRITVVIGLLLAFNTLIMAMVLDT